MNKRRAKFRRTGTVADLPRQPRSRVTTRRQDRRRLLDRLRNRHLTAADTARVNNGIYGQPYQRSTVRNRLKSLEKGVATLDINLTSPMKQNCDFLHWGYNQKNEILNPLSWLLIKYASIKLFQYDFSVFLPNLILLTLLVTKASIKIRVNNGIHGRPYQRSSVRSRLKSLEKGVATLDINLTSPLKQQCHGCSWKFCLV